ncbi:GTPase domain-containing protein [Gymnodinialimonas sp.]
MESLLSVILTLTTIASTLAAYFLWQRQSTIEDQTSRINSLERALEIKDSELKALSVKAQSLENFSSSVYTTTKEYHNLVVIGPRGSGKSSIVSLWCKIEQIISSISPTPNFETHEYKVGDTREESFFDENISVKRLKRFEKWIRIYDYAGEDGKVLAAAQRLASTKGSSVIFVFNADLSDRSSNTRYYSRIFAERLNDAFTSSGTRASSVEQVCIVFNKIDLAQDYEKGNFSSILHDLKNEYSTNLDVIESIFAPNLKYFTVSAETNVNILNLLQGVVNGVETFGAES